MTLASYYKASDVNRSNIYEPEEMSEFRKSIKDFFKGFEEVEAPQEQPAEEKVEEDVEKPVRELKPKEKKQPKKNVETLTKITELEKKEVTRPAKKRPAKKGPAFVVKKAPKTEGSKGGFDLSGFENASKGGKKGK